LQVGLVLQSLGASLQADHDRAGIYLTNALTGWEPVTTKPLPFPELEEERKKADKVKQEAPILVILGNPPYNGFAGMAVEEERSLSDAYRTTKKVRRPEGQGLNDLYVRFFRMAERRIAEKTGRGIVSFISNYSWLDALSFTGMRERYLEAFDAIRIDCLNGDKFKTGKTTPDGSPDPSIFSTEHNREGIQVGTAIAMLIRKENHAPTSTVAFRHLWGAAKRQELLETAEADTSALYQTVSPSIELGLPFVLSTVGVGYYEWPKLTDLFPVYFPGVQTKRDSFLIDIDRDRLETRVAAFFDQSVGDEDMSRTSPESMRATAQYDVKKIRARLQKRGMRSENIVRHLYRPFDVRWLYYEEDENLLSRRSPEYWEHWDGKVQWLSVSQRTRKGADEPQALVFRQLSSLHLIEWSASFFPAETVTPRGKMTSSERLPNVSATVGTLLQSFGATSLDLLTHACALFHSCAYLHENAAGLAMDWPRVPVPRDAKQLRASADLGAKLASLLNPDNPVDGVNRGKLRPSLRVLGLPYKQNGKALTDDDLTLLAGWGHVQTSRTGSTLVMPGAGLTKERDYTSAELTALAEEAKALSMPADAVLALLGKRTLDVYLNANAMWSNVPANVWAYTLGGYQVIKKWLSYREAPILGRALKPDEVAYVSEMVRRIASILLLGPALDANYLAAKSDAVEWSEGRPVMGHVDTPVSSH
jgi:predicted helicase